jgi:hypothetical protein
MAKLWQKQFRPLKCLVERVQLHFQILVPSLRQIPNLKNQSPNFFAVFVRQPPTPNVPPPLRPNGPSGTGSL